MRFTFLNQQQQYPTKIRKPLVPGRDAKRVWQALLSDKSGESAYARLLTSDSLRTRRGIVREVLAQLQTSSRRVKGGAGGDTTDDDDNDDSTPIGERQPHRDPPGLTRSTDASVNMIYFCLIPLFFII